MDEILVKGHVGRIELDVSKYPDGVYSVMLRSVPTAEALRDILSGLMKEEPVSSNRFKIWKGRLINGKKADK